MRDIGLGPVGRKRVRIVAQAADADAAPGDQILYLPDLRLRNIGYVQMRYARIAALRLPGRPAHQLHAVEAGFGGELKDLFQGQFRQYGADESQFHDAIPFETDLIRATLSIWQAGACFPAAIRQPTASACCPIEMERAILKPSPRFISHFEPGIGICKCASGSAGW